MTHYGHKQAAGTALSAQDEEWQRMAIIGSLQLRDAVRAYWDKERRRNKTPPLDWVRFEGGVD